jgi:hypothetical protein
MVLSMSSPPPAGRKTVLASLSASWPVVRRTQTLLERAVPAVVRPAVVWSVRGAFRERGHPAGPRPPHGIPGRAPHDIGRCQPFESLKAYKPRRAGRPRLFEPRFRPVRLPPCTTSGCPPNQVSTKARLPRMTPRVKCCTRRVSTSAARRRSLGVVSRSLTLSDTPRLTVVPSSRFRTAPCPPRIAR